MSIYLQGENGNIVIARNSQRPNMTGHGSSWDNFPVFINGERTRVYLDTTRGDNMYFKHDDKWYKVAKFDRALTKPKPRLTDHPEWGNLVFKPFDYEPRLTTVSRDDWRDFLREHDVDVESRGI